VNNDDHSFDPFQILADHAEHLNAICSPALGSKNFYEMMSGALVWSDETNREIPIKVIWSLRFIFAYRTSLLLNKPREELKPLWDHALSLFPKWVGFRPERRQPTPDLMRIYRRGDVSLRKCLRDMEREMARQPKGDAEPGAAPDSGGRLAFSGLNVPPAGAAGELVRPFSRK
jgi:hypothetical protein